MQRQKYLLITFSILTALVVAYLTYIYRSTGVPFYRHNEVYQILQSDTIQGNDNQIRNYTQPFKKYSLIDDEDELNFSYPDSPGFSPLESDNSLERRSDFEPVP